MLTSADCRQLAALAAARTLRAVQAGDLARADREGISALSWNAAGELAAARRLAEHRAAELAEHRRIAARCAAGF